MNADVFAVAGGLSASSEQTWSELKSCDYAQKRSASKVVDAAKFVLAELQQGVRRGRIARGLGVGWATIEQWLPKPKERKREKLFRRLSVTKSQAAESGESVEVEASKVSRIVVTSPSGLMIEGLTIAELAYATSEGRMLTPSRSRRVFAY